MTKKYIIIISILAGVVALFFLFNHYIYWEKQGPPGSSIEITSFTDCVRAGNPVMESYPRQCNANGQNFVEDIGNVIEKIELINVQNPQPNDIIYSPLEVVGTARGTWFFEASFPVELLDANGRQVAIEPAQAVGEWMTEDFVPFKAILSFTEVTTDTGTLVLKKDNPSGLPEHDDELHFPVRFR